MVMMASMSVMVSVPVSAAFWLESCADSLQFSSEATEHVFDHMVGANKKDLASNLRRQVAIAQVPGKAHQLNGIFMPDFDNILWRGLDL